MTPPRLTISVLVIAAVIICSSAFADASCGTDNGMRGSVETSKSWVATNTPIYALTDRLKIGGFDRRPWRYLPDHGFGSTPSIYTSSNRQWILYGAWLKGERSEEYWLFDTSSQHEQRVIKKEAFGGGIPTFSPSSDLIAFFNSFDNRWTSQDGIGLYLIETKSGRSTYYGYPKDSAVPANLAYGSTEWSKNGDVLLHLVGHPSGVFTREFYLFSTAGKKFRKIAGNYDANKTLEIFLDDGKVIPIAEQAQINSTFGTNRLSTPNGSLQAEINANYELFVKPKSGKPILVDRGAYENCLGINIWINGWVDNGKYLVYSKSEIPYIYDPVTRRGAPLFSANANDIPQFTW